jgi:hypothetical protein
MARGLSYVQKRILLVALQERFVLCQDLLKIWGLRPGAVINKAKYGAAHSALSRSLTRLYLRGLIEYWQDKLYHYKTAITLTDEGKSIAETLILN